ncbi:hypothetical protein ACTVNX_16290 [Serratia nevei]|uniref:hypothetical protein n=1 Tax=Serratia TaxID=613 RepID=UPI0018D80B67|nr:hypothetical protein [Serratia marcescens]MBH2876054.1 hypothetical protein [Serratia marcescens]MBI6131436.1 hypothetical protein [Serratia marcescens]MBN5304152.1 hypothetical protein [Serratia marcescens]MBY4847794.1 hypothetical protein [Serratia marcescens]MCH9865800.1 hypothetical protein [Serratia marcescens]
MITQCFDGNFFPGREPPQKKPKKKISRDKLENHDGSTMYVAEFIAIDIEEVKVSDANGPHLKVPLTFKSAMWMGLGFVAIALSGAWAMYTHLDNKLETYRTGTEAKIELARSGLDSKIDALGSETRSHFESSRIEAKSDNAALSSQLKDISNSISELNGKLSKDK